MMPKRDASTIKFCGALGLLAFGLVHFSTVTRRTKFVKALTRQFERMEDTDDLEGMRLLVSQQRTLLAEIEGAVPIVLNPGEIIVSVTRIMDDAQLDQRMLSSNAVRVEADLLTIPVNISFEGTYAQSFVFLRKLSDNGRAWNLDILRMHRSGTEPQADALSIEAKLVFYGRQAGEVRHD